MDLDDYDDLYALLKKYEERYPSDAAKFLLNDIKDKQDLVVRESIL